MKKGLELLSFAATAAVLVAVISWGGVAQAQQTSPNTDQTPSQAAPPPQSQPDAQQPPSQTPGNQTQPPDTQAPPSRPGQAGQAGQTPDQTQSDTGNGREFVGTVVKQGNKYLFQDTASGQTYDIDHQDEVKKFEGKKVRVRGTLDASTNTIHVQ